MGGFEEGGEGSGADELMERVLQQQKLLEKHLLGSLVFVSLFMCICIAFVYFYHFLCVCLYRFLCVCIAFYVFVSLFMCLYRFLCACIVFDVCLYRFVHTVVSFCMYGVHFFKLWLYSLLFFFRFILQPCIEVQ